MATRLSSLMFLLGKFIRFFFFLWFLLVLRDRIEQVAGYSLDQLIVFFLIFNFFDLIGQLFYRGIYWFRYDIVSGNFDFKLVKPLNPLFQVLTTHTDFLDIPVLILVVVFLGFKIPTIATINLLPFAVLSLVSMLILTAIHIVVAAIGVITTEVDHTIWIFRDLASMARVPTDIYTGFIRALLTFVVPVALVFTYPAKALLGLLSWQLITLTVLAALLVYFLALKFWHYALTQYSSASS